MGKYAEDAKELLRLVGGKENIAAVSHCMTRMRFVLGVFFVALNCICLSFVQIHALFYFNYIIYYGLLIFCCHFVATPSNFMFKWLKSAYFRLFSILFQSLLSPH